jgi:hypothetical protein
MARSATLLHNDRIAFLGCALLEGKSRTMRLTGHYKIGQ